MGKEKNKILLKEEYRKITQEKMALLFSESKSGIINFDAVQQQVDEMNEKQKYINMHKYDIWQNEKDEMYRTYLPDDKKGRKLIKRKHKKDIIDAVISYYQTHSEKQEIQKKNSEETLLTIFPKWLNYKQKHTNSTSYTKRITIDWQKFYVPDAGLINTPLNSFTKIYLDEWSHNKIKEYNMTKKCYYNMSLIIRQCLDYAVECGYIEENVFSKVKINTKLFRKTKKKLSETQVYTYEEEIKLIDDMFRRFKNNPKSTSPLMVILAFETGVRIGELCALKFSDIEGNYIHIQRQEIGTFEKVDDYKMKFKSYEIAEYTKSDDGFRSIFLTDNARKIIEIAKEVNEIYNKNNPEGFIFCSKGKNINHYSVMAMIKRGCEYVKMDVKTSHKIRKTYISTLIDSGLNIVAIRCSFIRMSCKSSYFIYVQTRIYKC